MTYFRYICIVCGVVLSVAGAFGQEQRSKLPADSLNRNSGAVLDSLAVKPAIKDTLVMKAPRKGGIQTTVNYSAEDSLILDLNSRDMTMFKTSDVDYGESKLEADRIRLNYATNEVDATGVKDTAGTLEGKPIFTEQGKTYELDTIRYNFATKKAVITGVVTQEGEGFIHGGNVKKNALDEWFIDKAKYTTCNLPHPHFHIEASKIKMLPGEQLVSGPFHLEFDDIPLPLVLPFGIFPFPDKNTSGVIIPTFGDEITRGFFLRDGGYYFHINDNINLTVTGDIYTKGSWGINLGSNYVKRYAYQGNFNFDYQYNASESEVDKNSTETFWLRWSHSPKSRPGQGRFSANVNLGSTKYNELNYSPNNPNNNLNQNWSSSVSYSKSFGRLVNLSSNASVNQNVSTGQVNLKLPSVSLSVNRINPFLKNGQTAKNWLQRINFTYNLQAENNISNAKVSPPSFKVINPDTASVDFTIGNIDDLLRRAKYGLKHRIPVSTSIKLFKYLTLSPNFNWNEITYFSKLDYKWDPEAEAVQIDTIPGIQRVYSYSGGASLNTRLYGQVNFSDNSSIKAIRHVMTPSVSMSFSPDFSTDKYGYYQDVQINPERDSLRLSRYNGYLYGTPGQGKSATMSFGITNTLEMKVLNKKDSTGEAKNRYKIVSLLDNFSINSGYNFAADSFKLSNISWSARTRLFNKKLSVNLSGTIDPYVYRLTNVDVDDKGNRSITQKRIDRYAWEDGKGIGQLSSLSLALNTSLNPNSKGNAGKDQAQERLDNDTNLDEYDRADLQSIINDPSIYVDWNVPWDLSVNYNFSYRKRGFEESTTTQSMRFSGNVSLSEKWKVTFSSGYNFEEKSFQSPTNIGIARDLHCWDMNVNWVPFGSYQSYTFTIKAKSSLLQDLKLNRSNNWRDR
ncbi:hypothetical protein FUAX_05930 [Fulvitalea axinellae]|uniref:LPS-assembly protein LptD central domain-containing protein n=1 Tax=Fulvitalea axinellae TaxID=1182444 RepID=A0AAU9CHC4_9BACT|nr:hypothetical protein FUAX_05930 [Fulvitalea axinellae]